MVESPVDFHISIVIRGRLGLWPLALGLGGLFLRTNTKDQRPKVKDQDFFSSFRFILKIRYHYLRSKGFVNRTLVSDLLKTCTLFVGEVAS